LISSPAGTRPAVIAGERACVVAGGKVGKVGKVGKRDEMTDNRERRES